MAIFAASTARRWKGALMVVNAVGHLAEAAWHHPDIVASHAAVEVRLQNHSAEGRRIRAS
jgi:4a-hydroxytetrahydrobiopterin dehydratase